MAFQAVDILVGLVGDTTDVDDKYLANKSVINIAYSYQTTSLCIIVYTDPSLFLLLIAAWWLVIRMKLWTFSGFGLNRRCVTLRLFAEFGDPQSEGKSFKPSLNFV